ncbi:MAG: hypothetical protein HY322_21475 [Betaproteobacteria bacterium]|nr:hypothetical protein [Betaproteobacteria bacterium]
MSVRDIRRTFARAVVLVLCAVVMAGCSLMRLGYGQLDHIAAWMADDYFDLDHQQKEEFHKRFARLHDWHRYEQLPGYAAFLREIKARVEKGLAREDVIWVTEGVRVRYRTIARRGADDAATLLLTITPQQIEALKRQWERTTASSCAITSSTARRRNGSGRG